MRKPKTLLQRHLASPSPKFLKDTAQKEGEKKGVDIKYVFSRYKSDPSPSSLENTLT